MSERLYVLYDARAIDGNTEDASILVTDQSREAALRSYRLFTDGLFSSGACYSYAQQGGEVLTGEKLEFIWFPGYEPDKEQA